MFTVFRLVFRRNKICSCKITNNQPKTTLANYGFSKIRKLLKHEAKAVPPINVISNHNWNIHWTGTLCKCIWTMLNFEIENTDPVTSLGVKCSCCINQGQPLQIKLDCFTDTALTELPFFFVPRSLLFIRLYRKQKCIVMALQDYWSRSVYKLWKD